MRTLVIKFGGAAVATPEHFAAVAEIIALRMRFYSRIAVVVSAMGRTTDELFDLARQVHFDPPKRELDMLLSVGERVSIALLAMALDAKKIEAISFTGSQSGIITSNDHNNARIIQVQPLRLLANLEKGRVVIVAGFQGMSLQGEITTLGRGGSDTTAVALGVALKADRVEFRKAVFGIYTSDPEEDPRAQLRKRLEFDEALEIVSHGSQVLHPRSVVLAKKNNLPLHVLSFCEKSEMLSENEVENLGTWIGNSSNCIRGEQVYEDLG